MNKSIWMALLSAAALIPAAAQAQDDNGQDRPPARKQWGGDGSHAPMQGRADGQRWQGGRDRAAPRGDRPQTAAPQASAMPVQPAARVEQRAQFDGRRDRARALDDNRRAWRAGAGGNAAVAGQYDNDRQRPAADRPDRPQDNRGVRSAQWHADGRGGGQWTRSGDRGQWNGNPGWNDPRHGGYRSGGGWSRDWRQDRRYDWNRYRFENRYAYRLPRYYAPRGWGYGYRRFSIGVSLNAALFDQTYWIDDPWSYRLPDAYGPYRWVRYYDDALLVDLESGRVVDTVYDIFD